MNHGILKSKFTLLLGAFLGSLAVLALALLTSSATATTPIEIVIQGPEASSSHLQLTMDGDNLIVNGTLEEGKQAGCEVTHGHNALSCPLSEAVYVAINMGSDSDKVEVLDKLPIPLTIHLGDGSDQFTGSDEADMCYPEGDANNSCDTGGGNDTCIMVTETNKCTGGAGNDICKASAGGDACYGGPGDDVCKMGPGEGKCLGEDGNDHLNGEAGSDHLSGGPGDDYVSGEGDSDKLYGDTGNDEVLGGASSDKIYGGTGNDRLNGGASSDKAYGGPGNDHLSGGPSPDKLYGESGKDYCNGESGLGKSYLCESGPGK